MRTYTPCGVFSDEKMDNPIMKIKWKHKKERFEIEYEITKIDIDCNRKEAKIEAIGKFKICNYRDKWLGFCILPMIWNRIKLNWNKIKRRK